MFISTGSYHNELGVNMTKVWNLILALSSCPDMDTPSEIHLEVVRWAHSDCFEQFWSHMASWGGSTISLAQQRTAPVSHQIFVPLSFALRVGGFLGRLPKSCGGASSDRSPSSLTRRKDHLAGALGVRLDHFSRCLALQHYQNSCR